MSRNSDGVKSRDGMKEGLLRPLPGGGGTGGDHERPRDECGVFGIYGAEEAANLTYLGLYALQHRGQESAGIISSDGQNLYSHRQMGLVADIFNQDVC